jgi:hypothetical protein
MSNLMNGAPFWSRPARTKEYDFAPVEEDKVSLLAELPELVRKAMANGLIKGPDPATPIFEKLGAYSEWAICVCGNRYARKKNSNVLCFKCRTPPKPCRSCGKMFHAPKWGQKTCSTECRIETIKDGARKKAKPPVEATCPICSTVYLNKTAHRKETKTCSKACGIELMKINQKITKSRNEN